MRLIDKVRASFADRPAVDVCDSCGSVSVCDTSCRAAAARDRATAAYLTTRRPGALTLAARGAISGESCIPRTRRSTSSRMRRPR